jgi:hypothetical protein
MPCDRCPCSDCDRARRELVHICFQCFGEYLPRRANQIYCSRRCKQKSYRHSRLKSNANGNGSSLAALRTVL